MYSLQILKKYEVHALGSYMVLMLWEKKKKKEGKEGKERKGEPLLNCCMITNSNT
jgi:hypothetical protein